MDLVGKVMSLLLNMLSRLVITFLSRSKRLLISWWQSPSAGEGNGNPLQYLFLENPRDRGACWAAVCGVAQSRTRLKQLSSSRLVLEKEMAAQSSILAWRILWTEEPGRLQSTGSKGVGYNS